MKRALLIVGGAVGGLGAVLAITPPQLNSSELSLPSGNTADTTNLNPTATTSSTSKASSTPTSPSSSTSNSQTTAVQNKSSTGTSSTTSTQSVKNSAGNSNPTESVAPAQDKSTPTTSNSTQSSPISGEFTGTPINVGYGIVQVKISVANGKIIDAVAVQAPSGRNDRWTNYALPILKQQTLAAQSDAISGASGASYTSYGWYKSLQSALTKAGML